MKFRTEKDSLGNLKVPKDAYWGIHTQRSLNNFQISGIEMHPEIITAIALLKISCAKANNGLKLLSSKKSNAIIRAAKEVIDGKLAEEFPLDIFQSGSGTSTHMNVNEVIANRANEILGGKKGQRSLVHPNDDVNKGQSTNNIIPSSIRISSYIMVDDLIDSLKNLQKEFRKKSTQFRSVLKTGRTHLQDAVPITLGQEFSAYATAMGKHVERLKQSKQSLRVLGVGGNAVGTGINTSKRFRSLIIRTLNKITGEKFVVTKDGIESTQFLTDVAGLSAVLKLIAIDINKIATDLRILSSGPKTGFNEINLPAIEPGSSIMPGKINPTIPELMNMVSFQVIGNDNAIGYACTAGILEVNTKMPLVAHNIMESMEILTNSLDLFSNKCIRGITANKEVCKHYAESSAGLATALNPVLGYDTVSLLVKESLKKDVPIKQLILEKKLLDKKKLDKILDPKNLTQPNLK